MSDAGSESYVLGHSEDELERLATQARLIDPITRRIAVAAGIAPGMRVLDIGSGAGDVAFLAADLVGPTGTVVGVDRSGAALATARARAVALSLQNVSFREGDPAEMSFDEPFDAVLGRYVLMFQADPAAMLRKLKVHVRRPGGVVVFHEGDLAAASSFPSSAIHDRCCEWWIELLRLTGADHRMGLKLHATFTAAGLEAPNMRLEAFVGGGSTCAEYLDVGVTGLIRSVQHDMERLGIATAAEIGLETLTDRMVDEVIANGSVIIGRSEIGAWARL